MNREKLKLIVLGLDGASFNLIRPWINDGSLPNIKRLIDEGTSGSLRSCLPPVTSPNWKCYSTGKNPGKLGIFWWENIDCRNKKIIYLPRSRIYLNKEIWDYLGEAGYRVGVLNMPLTYPPKKVSGFLVSGPPDGIEKNFTFPTDLQYRLTKKFNYKINPEWLSLLEWSESTRSGREKAVREILKLIENRFRAAKALIKEYSLDFLHMTIFYINTLHHFFWNDNHVKEAWKLIDTNIGSYINNINIILFSDHGTNKIDQVFYINSWLAEKGYLSIKNINQLQNLLHKIGINRESLTMISQKLGIRHTLSRVIPKQLFGQIPTSTGSIEFEHREKYVIWDKTKAIASGQGPIYINMNKETEEYERFRNDLILELESLRNQHTDKRISEKVHKVENEYSGRFLSEAPDLIVEQAPGTHIRGSIGKKGVFDRPRKWRAENRRNGIFIAHGPGIKKKAKLHNVSILDLAPTILHLFGGPVPPDMDGRKLSEIFKEGSNPVRKNFQY